MDMERIEARCRIGNWLTIATGFLALSSPLVLMGEAIVWLARRRWPTLASVSEWRPATLWLRPIAYLPLSLIVLAVGATSFTAALTYWRRQERLLRRRRGEQSVLRRLI
ncbi:hypothetical protein [Sphingomonas profundi]|uniref:hypothetical protein n=1 Tax=Alterirhizorhabdus profundi TaxID=2681549 RepID=UPI0012E7E7D9|nr:hypothetical protein [Sphingomonas profundi]